MARILRAPFDASRDFIAARPFPFNGKQVALHQPFDKSQVTLRLLRQMYDNRWLRFKEDVDEWYSTPAIKSKKVERVPLKSKTTIRKLRSTTSERERLMRDL